mmetsp:Transcript_86512/g.231894  ORF Transcript_86512/g.231894 Transcript_86512/m.231894 type:complete len:208 (-) Transcript_86512:1302-1925(-)
MDSTGRWRLQLDTRCCSGPPTSCCLRRQYLASTTACGVACRGAGGCEWHGTSSADSCLSCGLWWPCGKAHPPGSGLRLAGSTWPSTRGCSENRRGLAWTSISAAVIVWGGFARLSASVFWPRRTSGGPACRGVTSATWAKAAWSRWSSAHLSSCSSRAVTGRACRLWACCAPGGFRNTSACRWRRGRDRRCWELGLSGFTFCRGDSV